MVTIAILGIIASLTMPAIMANVIKSQSGPALLKAINSFNTANAIMVNEHDMYSFREGCGLPDGDIAGSEGSYETTCFGPFILDKLGGGNETKTVKYVQFNPGSGNALTITPSANQHIYSTKSGVAYIFPGEQKQNIISLYIDTNGINKKPNQMGKDLFSVYIDVDRDGTILPIGSSEYVTKTGDAGWETKCGPNNTVNDLNWVYCSGSIVDNNGKIVYKW